MSEIEKMYENAGLFYCDRCRYDSELDCIYMCESKYPPFTAEKQIKLIKWLINEVDYITMWHFNNSKKPYDFDLGSLNSGGETFEDALAQMINNLWQDLTEEKKQQVRGILK